MVGVSTNLQNEIATIVVQILISGAHLSIFSGTPGGNPT